MQWSSAASGPWGCLMESNGGRLDCLATAAVAEAVV